MIVIYTRWNGLTPDHVTIDCLGRDFRIVTRVKHNVYVVHLGETQAWWALAQW